MYADLPHFQLRKGPALPIGTTGSGYVAREYTFADGEGEL
jgi:hypothetical protein